MTSIIARRLALTWILTLTQPPALAQAVPAAQTPVPFAVRAVRTAEPPDIDGDVEDDEWTGATVIKDFIQYEPHRGERSPSRTEAMVLYDDTHLYVAFRAWDAEPLTAQLTRRDSNLLSDDAVIVLLDSFHDRQTAYAFLTNPLGTQTDGRVSDDGRASDPNWDADWSSAARRTDYGWSAEMAIPLKSIQYSAGQNQTWGLNLGRSRRRTLDLSFWTGPLDQQYRVSQAGELTGLDVRPPEKRYQLIPYGLTRVQERESPYWQAGADLRYAVTPSTAAYATVNPDFATVEADKEEINLTRFELQLPEKRQFFLEGQEHFRQRIRTFYSRRIADISGGGKILGKEGSWSTAIFSTQTKATDDRDAANYSVVRLARDVGQRSIVGFLGANRLLNGVNQGSMGLDTNVFLGKTFNFTGQLVQSYGQFDTGTWAFFVRPSYDSPTGHVHVRYQQMGSRFADNVNAIGFVRDDDRREIDGAIEKTLWIRGDTVERAQYGSNYNVYWSTSGALRSWKIDQSAEVEFTNRWSVEGDYSEEYIVFEKPFRNRAVSTGLGYNTRQYQQVSGSVEFGRNFDADFQLWELSAQQKVTDALSVEYGLQRLALDPDPEEESTWIHVVRASQFFTKDLFLRVFFQTNSTIERNNLQALFVYRYLPPFGSLQLVYQRGTAEFGERSDQGHTLFVKATAVF